MNKFNLISDLKPTGDQPQAIEKISEKISNNVSEQTLLGVTGSGKTFTMAGVIEKVQKPTLVLAHNKTLAAQLATEFKEFFPQNAVEYFVSYYDYYQPEAYVPRTDTYIEKDASINEDLDKLRHSATRSLLTRKDVLIVASVSCIYGLGSPEEYQGFVASIEKGETKTRKSLIEQLINITGKHLKTTEVGAFLSHTKAILQAQQDKVDWAIILEDDVIISKHFNDILEHIKNKDADCIRLYVRNLCLAGYKTKISKRKSYKNWGGALGYAINQHGINKFIKTSDEFYMKIDNFLFGYWIHKLNIYQVDKNLVDIEQSINSDIGYDKSQKQKTKVFKRLIYKIKYNAFRMFN